MPYHNEPHTIPKAHKDALKNEAKQLVKIGILCEINHSEWAAPSFIILKKDWTVRFMQDSRKLNKQVKRFLHPLPKFSDSLLKLEGFVHAMSLDLNVGHCYICLDPASCELCTIVLLWGKCKFCALLIGLSLSISNDVHFFCALWCCFSISNMLGVS